MMENKVLFQDPGPGVIYINVLARSLFCTKSWGFENEILLNNSNLFLFSLSIQAHPDRALFSLPSVVIILTHWASPAPVTESICTGPSTTQPATKAFAYATQVSHEQLYTGLDFFFRYVHLELIIRRALLPVVLFVCEISSEVPFLYCANETKMCLPNSVEIARKMIHLHGNVPGEAGTCSSPCFAAHAWELVNARFFCIAHNSSDPSCKICWYATPAYLALNYDCVNI